MNLSNYVGVLLLTLAFAPGSPAAEIFLTTGIQTRQEWMTSNDHQAQEKGKIVRLINPAVVAQGYTPNQWLLLTNAQPVEAMVSSSFQKLDVAA